MDLRLRPVGVQDALLALARLEIVGAPTEGTTAIGSASGGELRQVVERKAQVRDFLGRGIDKSAAIADREPLEQVAVGRVRAAASTPIPCMMKAFRVIGSLTSTLSSNTL